MVMRDVLGRIRESGLARAAGDSHLETPASCDRCTGLNDSSTPLLNGCSETSSCSFPAPSLRHLRPATVWIVVRILAISGPTAPLHVTVAKDSKDVSTAPGLTILRMSTFPNLSCNTLILLINGSLSRYAPLNHLSLP